MCIMMEALRWALERQKKFDKKERRGSAPLAEELVIKSV